MTHFCFVCGKRPTPKQFESCKELGHDIDYEDDFQPISSNQKKEQYSNQTKLLKFATPRIKKLVQSDSDSNQVWAVVEADDHFESFKLGSTASIDWLKSEYFSKEKEFFSDDVYKMTLSLIRANARHAKASKEIIYKRCAHVGGAIYYDLCSPNWKLVKITQEEIKIINFGIDTPLFARSSNQSQQIEPTMRPDENALKELCQCLRINVDLFQIHLILFLVESIHVPINAHIGQQGSIKSTQTALIKMLIDPNGTSLADQLTHLPKKSEDLNLILSNNYYTVFDNVSDIDDTQSDIFCKAITGASYARRQLYENDTLSILKIRRKIGINGIAFEIKNGDLQERTIPYESIKVSKSERITEAKVLEKFRSIQSDVLGLIFQTLQKTLAIVEDVEAEIKEKPRMADFAIWGEAVSRVLGNKSGDFIQWYADKINSGIDTLSEASPLIPFIEEYFASSNSNPNQVQIWYSLFKKYAEENQYDKDLLPKAPNKLRGYARKHQPILEQEGYEITFEKNTSEKNDFMMGATLIGIKKVSSERSGHSEQTELPEDTEHNFQSLRSNMEK
jgi:hypothetical protein